MEDPADIIIDIAICGDEAIDPKDKTSRNSMYDFFRGHSIHSYYHSTDQLADAYRAYPEIEWRYLFLEDPKIELELDFRNETTWPWQL